MAFSGRKWQKEGSSGPRNGLFGPEVTGGRQFRPGEWPFRAGGGTREAIPARGMAFSGRKWQKGGSSGPGMGLFGLEVAEGRQFRPGEWPFRAGSGRREAVQAHRMAFSGRRGAEGRQFRPTEWPFRAGGGRREAFFGPDRC